MLPDHRPAAQKSPGRGLALEVLACGVGHQRLNGRNPRFKGVHTLLKTLCSAALVGRFETQGFRVPDAVPAACLGGLHLFLVRLRGRDLVTVSVKHSGSVLDFHSLVLVRPFVIAEKAVARGVNTMSCERFNYLLCYYPGVKAGCSAFLFYSIIKEELSKLDITPRIQNSIRIRFNSLLLFGVGSIDASSSCIKL